MHGGLDPRQWFGSSLLPATRDRTSRSFAPAPQRPEEDGTAQDGAGQSSSGSRRFCCTVQCWSVDMRYLNTVPYRAVRCRLCEVLSGVGVDRRGKRTWVWPTKIRERL